jgi:hypothetical protein
MTRLVVVFAVSHRRAVRGQLVSTRLDSRRLVVRLRMFVTNGRCLVSRLLVSYRRLVRRLLVTAGRRVRRLLVRWCLVDRLRLVTRSLVRSKSILLSLRPLQDGGHAVIHKKVEKKKKNAVLLQEKIP